MKRLIPLLFFSFLLIGLGMTLWPRTSYPTLTPTSIPTPTTIIERTRLTKIVLLATIAPSELYAKDASESAQWSDTFRREEALWIKRYLENAIQFARRQNLPLVNAYEQSLDGLFGKTFYINPKDDIHPSEAGHEFVSFLISEKLKELGWLEKK